MALLTRMTRKCIQTLVQFNGKNALYLGVTSRWSGTDSKAKISRFPVPDVKDLPEDLQQVMQENLDKAGFIPNVFRTLAHRPKELRAFISYYDAIMSDRLGGNVTKADKEMIIVAVSSMNGCRYCIVAHGALFRIYAKNTIIADQVAANWETADLEAKQRAILNYAMQCAQCKRLEDSHFQALYDHGMNDEDAWDIGAVVAFFSHSNRMALMLDMAPNEEFYMLGRVPRSKK